MVRVCEHAHNLLLDILRIFCKINTIAQRLAHLHIVHIDIAVVHPVVGKGAAIGALTLGNLVLMVGKDQVLTAAVQVNGGT